jgi:hypothetical protein
MLGKKIKLWSKEKMSLMKLFAVPKASKKPVNV